MNTTVEPRIYVASLSDYNAGRLHGAWIDLSDKSEEEVWEEINAMLKGSREPFAEEWAIHDVEGLSPWNVSEYESIADIVKVVEAIDEHGPNVLHWISFRGDDVVRDAADGQDLAERFGEEYQGQYSSKTEAAYELVSEIGLPGVGALYTEQNPYATVREGPSWREVLSQIDSYLNWDAIADAVIDEGVEIDHNTYLAFRSV